MDDSRLNNGLTYDFSTLQRHENMHLVETVLQI